MCIRGCTGECSKVCTRVCSGLCTRVCIRVCSGLCTRVCSKVCTRVYTGVYRDVYVLGRVQGCVLRRVLGVYQEVTCAYVHSALTHLVYVRPVYLMPCLQGYLKTVQDGPMDLAIPVRMKQNPQDFFGNAADLYHFHRMCVLT